MNLKNDIRHKIALCRAAVLVAAAAVVFLTGCAPTVQLQVQRTPNWNTAGIKRVAVMPFEYSHSHEQRETAQFLTTMALTGIQRTNHFTLVSASEISRLRERGESIENHVDALFTGKIMSIVTEDTSFITQQYDPNIKQTVDVNVFERRVTLTVSYSLERARDGTLVGIANRTATAKDQQFDYYNLKPTSQLLQQCHVFGSLHRDIAPYTTMVTRTLMSEKSKDKILKEKMKNAAAHVNQKSYRSALNAYLKIYDEHSNLAAAYNAGVMHEALGDTDAAQDLLTRTASETGNPMIKEELARLNKRIAEQKTVDTEYRGAVRQIDKVIATAADEAYAVLPPNSKVWFVNSGRNEQALAISAVDGISAALIKKGVTVVDRENVQLIEQEKLFQMSGSTNDGDFVKAGYMAGANVIATISITGTGTMRRLQLRILDVEKGTPLLQSDASGKWDM